MNKNEIINELNTIENPYGNSQIDFKELLTKFDIDEDKIIIEFKELGSDAELNRKLNRQIIRKLKIDMGYKFVKLTHPIKEVVSENMIGDHTKVLAIMSGKGGVGKSQVTCNLARTLSNEGKKVGIIDADIYGYSIPKILKLYGEPQVENKKIYPLKTSEGIEVISTQYFLPDNENAPIVWRAPKLNGMMKVFFKEVKWNKELDYLLIDLPPGTGDITLNLSQYVETTNALLVTTASEDASHVAVRSGILAKDLGMNLLGVVENMSYYQHGDEKLQIFGTGGGERVAEELASKLLVKLPILPKQDDITKYLKPVVKILEEE